MGAERRCTEKTGSFGIVCDGRVIRVSSEEVLYIGDSEVDAATGNAADMDTVLVEWGFRSREELEKADAYRIVAAADEILDIIR